MSDLESHTKSYEITAFQAGDEAAVTSAYDRYAAGIFSYFLARTDDEDIAAEATRQTFLRASSDEATPLIETEKLWMFQNARDVARDEDMGFAALGHEADGDMRLMALDAVSGLGTRDRNLMVLRATGQLDDEGVTTVAGLDPAHAEEVLAKTRRRVEGALGPLLLARFGTDECTDLRNAIGNWDGSFSGEKRAVVNRHVTSCAVCNDNRAALVGNGGVLPQLFTVAAPVALRDTVVAELVVVPEPEPEPAPPGPDTVPVAATIPATQVVTRPPPIASENSSRDLAMLGAFMVLAVVLGLIGFAVADQFEPLDDPASTVVPTSLPESRSAPTTTIGRTTTAPTSDTSSTEAVTVGPPAFEVSADIVDFGGDSTTGEFEIANTGGQAGVLLVESSSEAIVLSADQVEISSGDTVSFEVGLDRDLVEEGEFDGTVTLTWDGGQIELAVVANQVDNPIIHNPQATPASVVVDGGSGCTNTQTTVSARITDTSSFEAVVRWSADGGVSQETAMTDVGGNIYEAVIGPFTAPQTADARIVAIDEAGNAGGASASIAVAPCP